MSTLAAELRARLREKVDEASRARNGLVARHGDVDPSGEIVDEALVGRVRSLVRRSFRANDLAVDQHIDLVLLALADPARFKRRVRRARLR